MRQRLALGSLVTLAAALGCGHAGEPATATPNGGATPADVIARLRTATAARDWVAFYRQTPPAELQDIAAGTYAMARIGAELTGRMAAGEQVPAAAAGPLAAQRRFVEAQATLASKYGIVAPDGGIPLGKAQRDPAVVARVFGHVDTAGYVGEMLALMDAHTAEMAQALPGGAPPGAEPAGDAGAPWADGPVYAEPLMDVTVTGDTATGTLGDHVAHFQRVDGRWYLHHLAGPR